MPNVDQKRMGLPKATPKRDLNVLIASPSDIPNAREIACRAIGVFNDLHSISHQVVLHSLMYERDGYPDMGRHPQAILNDQLVNRAHLCIAIFGNKLGTPTPRYESGTIEEIDTVFQRGGKVGIFFEEPPLLEITDKREFRRREKYRESIQANSSYQCCNTLEEMQSRIIHFLDCAVGELTRKTYTPAISTVLLKPRLSPPGGTITIPGERTIHDRNSVYTGKPPGQSAISTDYETYNYMSRVLDLYRDVESDSEPKLNGLRQIFWPSDSHR